MTNAETPTLTEREHGGWMAVSPDSAAIRIGVLGETEQAATENYSRAFAAWKRLLALARARADGQ